MANSLDPGMLQQMAELGSLMQQMRPFNEMARNYPFMGQESVTLDQAMELMDQLQQLDGLERQIFEAAYTGELDRISKDELERLLGPEAREAAENLDDIARKLEEAGYAR